MAERRELAPDQAWGEEKIEQLRGGCHPKQRDFVDDPALLITAIVGREGGKTTGGAARLIQAMLRKPEAQCVFVAATRPVAELLIWDKVLKVLDRIGVEYRASYTKLWITLKRNGSRLRLVGADDKKEINKLRGQSFDEVGIDEAGSFDQKLLEDLIDRVIAPRLLGALWMTSTPTHILSGIFYDATRDGSDRHRRYEDRGKPEYQDWGRWSSHFWTLNDPGAQDVPAMRAGWARALKRKKDNGWSDDNPIWRREYLGEWAADDSENVFKYRPHKTLDDGSAVEWNQWDPKRVGPMRFAELPERDGKPVTDWCHVYAMDMGSKDPFALNVFAFSPSDSTRTIYHVYSFEQRALYANAIAQRLIGDALDHDKMGGCIGWTGWPTGLVMDADQATLDELMRVYGIRIGKAVREANYKFGAIELVNGDLIDGRIKILKDSPLHKQLLELQWQADQYGAVRENKAQANHSTDCLVHGRKLIAHLFDTGGVEAPRQEYRDPQGLDAGEPDGTPGDFDELLGGDGLGMDELGNTL